MANNYTLFSFDIPAITVDEAEWCVKELKRREDSDDELCGWTWKVLGADERPELRTAVADALEREQQADPRRRLWLYAEESANIETAVRFLQDFLARWRPADVLGFEWAHTCSSPRLGEFGGGAAVVTANYIKWMNTTQWLGRTLAQTTKQITRGLAKKG